jgi:hypothetical protein
MARLRSTAFVLSLITMTFGITGCAFETTNAPASPTAEVGAAVTEWPSITAMIAGSIQPTFDAFEGTWDVQQAAPRESACWTESENLDGSPHWETRPDGYEVAFYATSSWFDMDEDPRTTVERYARVWESLFPATNFDPDYDSFAYGAQLAGLVDSDQLQVTGGFDGDNWIFRVEVSCDTPGFRAPVPGVSIEPFSPTRGFPAHGEDGRRAGFRN